MIRHPWLHPYVCSKEKTCCFSSSEDEQRFILQETMHHVPLVLSSTMSAKHLADIFFGHNENQQKKCGFLTAEPWATKARQSFEKQVCMSADSSPSTPASVRLRLCSRIGTFTPREGIDYGSYEEECVRSWRMDGPEVEYPMEFGAYAFSHGSQSMEMYARFFDTILQHRKRDCARILFSGICINSCYMRFQSDPFIFAEDMGKFHPLDLVRSRWFVEASDAIAFMHDQFFAAWKTSLQNASVKMINTVFPCLLIAEAPMLLPDSPQEALFLARTFESWKHVSYRMMGAIPFGRPRFTEQVLIYYMFTVVFPSKNDLAMSFVAQVNISSVERALAFSATKQFRLMDYLLLLMAHSHEKYFINNIQRPAFSEFFAMLVEKLPDSSASPKFKALVLRAVQVRFQAHLLHAAFGDVMGTTMAAMPIWMALKQGLRMRKGKKCILATIPTDIFDRIWLLALEDVKRQAWTRLVQERGWKFLV